MYISKTVVSRLCEGIALLLSAALIVSICPLVFVALTPLLYGGPRSSTTVCEYRERLHTTAVFFYVWYERCGNRGQWAHRTVVDEPAIGYYSSMDINAIEWQLRMLRAAEIDFLPISWWESQLL